MSIHPEIAAVVMAGGKSSRLGELGRVRPKCLLPLPSEETLLTRLLNQLRRAWIKRVLVCCSSENFSSINACVEIHQAKAAIPATEVQAVICSNCQTGPLPALAETLSKVRAPWRLLCLADVVFEAAPFLGARSCLSNRLDGLLLTGTDVRARNGGGSGFVDCEHRSVRRIAYKNLGKVSPADGGERRWSGSFFFREALFLERSDDLFKHQAAPFENWIQALLEQGARCEWAEGGPFVNVNSAEDYKALLERLAPGTAVEQVDANH